MQRRFPDCSFEGIEPSRRVERRAQEAGLPVQPEPGSGARPYDIVYSVAVIEHVASPTRFLADIGSRLDPDRVRRVVQRIAASSQRGKIGILQDLARLVRLDRDRHRAVVETAAGLPDEMRRDVQAGLERAYGQGLETSFALNPDLIGGMRIRVGSDVYDGSVRARLAALEARL